jgi:DNA-binding NarL/FixJ family response regulator
MAKPRLLLADDHTLVVEAFTRLLEDEFEIVKVFTDGISRLREAPALKPDVVVLDLSMPLLNGMDAGKELKRILPSTKIVVLTMSEDFELADEAVRHWASAYLLKKSAARELVMAIHEVMAHRTYVTPRIAQRAVDEFVRDPNPNHRKHPTTQQLKVLQLLAEGKSMKEGAAALNISPRTVAFHKYQLMTEQGLKTHSDIVMFAIKGRVVVPPPPAPIAIRARAER